MDGNAWVSILLILVSISVAIALASSIGESLAKTRSSSGKTIAATIVSRVNEAVVAEFRKAWRISGWGSGEIEGTVLLCQDADGAISAKSLGQTNQRRRFPIICVPAVIAIVHTHPNKSDASAFLTLLCIIIPQLRGQSSGTEIRRLGRGFFLPPSMKSGFGGVNYHRRGFFGELASELTFWCYKVGGVNDERPNRSNSLVDLDSTKKPLKRF